MTCSKFVQIKGQTGPTKGVTLYYLDIGRKQFQKLSETARPTFQILHKFNFILDLYPELLTTSLILKLHHRKSNH